MNTLLTAGFAVHSLNPPLGATMAGYAARRGGATGVHDELGAHVMILRRLSDSVMVISLDLEEVPDELALAIRQDVSDRTGVPMKSILVAATHTHSGPLVAARLGKEADRAVAQDIRQAVLVAASEAAANMKSVTMKAGSASCPDVAKDRRNLEPSLDSQVNLIGFYAEQELVGCVVNFPLHATVLGAENRLYSADYPGYLRRTIQDNHPQCCTLFLNGAAGDINIGYSADASALGERFDFRTFEKAAEVGERLAEAVVSGLDRAHQVSDPILEVGINEVALPLKDPVGLDELNCRILDHRINKRELKAIYLECLKDSILRQNLREGQSEVIMPLQAIRIGSGVLVAIPGELFVELGLAIRESRKDVQIFVVGYANGAWGYLPDRKAFGQGGYEVETSIFSEGMGETLVRGAVRLVNSL